MNWQERLNEHEETAPKDTWDHLRQSLELDRSELREKLLALESEPPATAWPGIRKSLETQMTAVPRIIPFFRRHAMSAGIAASLLLVLYVYRGPSSDIPSATAGMTGGIRSNTQTGSLGPANRPPAPITSSVSGNADKTAEGIPVLAGSSSGQRTPSPTPKSHLIRKTKQIGEARGANYIEICHEKGECDRLTYKLEAWAPCLNTSCSDAEGARAEKARRIEGWRAKLEKSTFIPAAGHFFDIGEMAQLLQSGDR